MAKQSYHWEIPKIDLTYFSSLPRFTLRDYHLRCNGFPAFPKVHKRDPITVVIINQTWGTGKDETGLPGDAALLNSSKHHLVLVKTKSQPQVQQGHKWQVLRQNMFASNPVFPLGCKILLGRFLSHAWLISSSIKTKKNEYNFFARIDAVRYRICCASAKQA